MKHDIIVLEDAKLSTRYEKRYVVVDKNTGEVLDDAQGYGYKTKKNAYSAYYYKYRDLYLLWMQLLSKLQRDLGDQKTNSMQN